MKNYIITYRSRYYRLETHGRRIHAPSKQWIRNNWHEIMLTDEYTIMKIEEEH